MSDTQLWRGAVLPAALVAGLSSTVMAFVNGQSGLFGALLASMTVIIFFSVHLLVARVSRDLDPMATWHLLCFHILQK